MYYCAPCWWELKSILRIFTALLLKHSIKRADETCGKLEKMLINKLDWPVRCIIYLNASANLDDVQFWCEAFWMQKPSNANELSA